jgi:hypothetical protein
VARHRAIKGVAQAIGGAAVSRFPGRQERGGWHKTLSLPEDHVKARAFNVVNKYIFKALTNAVSPWLLRNYGRT